MSTRHIYVISDLHLGGSPATADRPSFQMCPPESRRRLARFIEAVRTSSLDPERAESPRELVINGDLVDFLAEQPFASFTIEPQAAVAKLKQIVKSSDDGADPGEQIFPALRRFVRDGHALTILIGNHDIELTLPAVRQELMDSLTEGRPARIEFLLDGEACRRGQALIEHGNRYDGWNAVPHGTLRAVRARASRGEPPFALVPPAGSSMVTDVINPLKGLYRFIDLLKPENEALIPLLSALHPGALREIRRIFNAWRNTTPISAGAVPDRETYVGDFEGDAGVVPDQFTQVGARRVVAVVDKARAVRSAPVWDEVEGDPIHAETLRRTEALLAEAEAATVSAGAEDDVVPDELSQVGDGGMAWVRSGLSLVLSGWSKDDTRYRHLRNALVQHHRTVGRTFALDIEHDEYLKAAERLESPDVKVVVFGHTHLPKSIRLPQGGHYVNTGTWCRTIRLDERLYDPAADEAAALALLRQFVEDMRTNTVDPWTNLRTPFAHIEVTSEKTTGTLCEFHDDGTVSTPMKEFA